MIFFKLDKKYINKLIKLNKYKIKAMEISSITGWKSKKEDEEWKEDHMIEGDLLLKNLESTDYTQDNMQSNEYSLSEKVDKKILAEK
jgi:hypothetical protein